MGSFGIGAMLPSPLEVPKSQGKERVVEAVDFRNDKALRIDVHVLIDVLALIVIFQPPSHGKGMCWSCGSMCAGASRSTWLGREHRFCWVTDLDKAEGINGLFSHVFFPSSPNQLLFPLSGFSDILVPLEFRRVIVLPCHGSSLFSGPQDIRCRWGNVTCFKNTYLGYSDYLTI